MHLDYDRYMMRALELARKGEGYVSPNPMVGAVIVDCNGNIIGEGWHRQYGAPHAEVNAFDSVGADSIDLLREATLFVTLEPCSHYGKTPPCADLIVRNRIKRVVVGVMDPFDKVKGQGITRLREAGIEVLTGVMEKECRNINKTFFFAHTNHIPYVTLKWAQSADDWMDSKNCHPYKFSTRLGQIATHRLRALNDAIITSTRTVILDNPRLDIRHWRHGRTPLKVIVGNSDVPNNAHVESAGRTLHYRSHDLRHVLSVLYSQENVTSVLVEGGSEFLHAFINENLWNEARIEISPCVLGKDGTIKAPTVAGTPFRIENIGGNRVYWYRNEQAR